VEVAISHGGEIIEFMWSSSVGKVLEHSVEIELLSRRWTDLSIPQGFKLIQMPYRQSVDTDQSIEVEYQDKHRILRRRRKKMQDIENQMLQLEKLAQTLHVTASNSTISQVSMVSISTTNVVSQGAIVLVHGLKQNRLNWRFILRAIVELQKGTGAKRCDPIDCFYCDSDESEYRRDAEETQVKCQEKMKERELQNGIASLIEGQHEQKALKQRKRGVLQGWWHTTNS
jgi:hypothetical protein